MEMELFLREILRRALFLDEDDHPLKILEELKNDGKEEVVCVYCNEPVVLGLAFKCKICPFLCHVSCFKETKYLGSTFYFHFGGRHDQLMLTEELKNDGKEGVDCVVCKEKVEAGPRYKCSASECNFQLHKSCAQLPREMHHPEHPDHILILQFPTEYASKRNCNACRKSCGKRLFYKCEECDFIIDITCATRTQVNNTGDCQHTFVPFFRKIHFTCEACGQEGMDFVSSCTICRLFIHSRCAGFPRTMIISRHDHALSLIYSLHHQVQVFNNVFCKLCGQKVKTQYAAFSCQECDFVAHLYCAKACICESLPEKSVDVMEKINPGEIHHFSHPHNLILSHDQEVLYDKLCDGCMHFIISAPFYNCTRCDFFLHTTCAQLPKEKKHILHQHTLALLPNAPYPYGSFRCNACGYIRHGFTYSCVTCSFDMDVQCCSILKTLEHEGHQHSLFLRVSSDKKCSACGNEYQYCNDRGIFVCTACDFALDFKCATLPLVARHRYDKHPLALTYATKDNFEEHYCLICEKEMNQKHWFYYCATCDFPAHSQCVLGNYPYIKFESTFKNEELHQHPLTYVRKTEYSTPCDACGKTFDGMALQCSQCKLNVHWWYSCLKELFDI
ncbi:uncharacterized protein LOC133872572 [Alnus glutinosa]|uniref:uncharacterized protein LOC133872572 n=1 Tax=Alnus glutinosa TaxID=3517 RepID=UPI002D7A2159|nr:uncharacterized protein LOC133872572 [Alnus glutinosa]